MKGVKRSDNRQKASKVKDKALDEGTIPQLPVGRKNLLCIIGHRTCVNHNLLCDIYPVVSLNMFTGT